ncbi:MAG TPA: DUF1501 domain-containing protein [Pirellulaceae bacterium]|nr:DUF1501 domain-containing protein [Pirellulaceae bacterium]
MASSFLDRRDFLQLGLAGSLGLALSPWGRQAFAVDEAAKAKACIFIYLQGGPSHIDTFDPKPGAKTGGPFAAIDTKIAGVKFAENFPRLAAVSDKLAVIRSLTSTEGDHDRAFTLVHTGYSPSMALTYPALGSVLARERAAPDSEAPPFVSFGGTSGPGYLGPEFGPYVIDDVNNPGPNLTLQEGFTEERMSRRVGALAKLNDGFGRKTASTRPASQTRLSQRADRLRKSPALQAYNFAEKEPELFKTYGGEIGDGNFARSCLLARRMIEHGVRFVEVRLDGWDTHSDNFNQVKNLSGPLDAGMAGLIEDLAGRGLLDQTLIVCLGEFGRTPQINGDNGRDHWNDVFSVVLAGGGLKAGAVVGASDEEGAKVKDRPVKIPDLFATLAAALGLDPARQYTTPEGRPIKLTNGGEVVKELLT